MGITEYDIIAEFSIEKSGGTNLYGVNQQTEWLL